MLLNAAEWQAVRLSVFVACISLIVSLPLATYVGWVLAKRQFPGKFLIETLINLPLVLPPVVTGYLLLVLFGRHGALGSYLEEFLGLRFVFNWKGAALAAAAVSFPLLVRPIRIAFAAVDNRVIQAARSLGAGRVDAFWTIALPLARPGILSGAVLAWARSLGEFGATIMIAGSIPGETRTISLMIYSLLESPDGIEQSRRLVIASIMLSCAALAVSEWLEQRGHRNRYSVVEV
jgi:molybdate transport system permease protein